MNTPLPELTLWSEQDRAMIWQAVEGAKDNPSGNTI